LLKKLLSTFLIILLGALVYASLSFGLQTLFLSSLEREGKIEIQGERVHYFALTRIPFRNLKIIKDKLFWLSSEEAVLTYSPLNTLLGQIPFRLEAQNLKLQLDERIGFNGFSEMPFDALDAKITVYPAKGLAVHSFTLKGETGRMTAQGYLVTRGAGDSNLTIHLSVLPDELGGIASLFTKNLFSESPERNGTTEPLDFELTVRGSVENPTFELVSDLIRVETREKVLAA